MEAFRYLWFLGVKWFSLVSNPWNFINNTFLWHMKSGHMSPRFYASTRNEHVISGVKSWFLLTIIESSH